MTPSVDRRQFLLAMSLTGAALLPPGEAVAQASVPLPSTPAGRAFAGWLAAINSGNRDTILKFVTEHYAPPPNGSLPVDRITNRQYGLARETGGMDVRKVVSDSETGITVILQERRLGGWKMMRMAVTPPPSSKITGFSFSGTVAPAELLPRNKLTDKEIHDRIDTLINKLVAADAFSGAILVARENKPIYARATGLASRLWKIPNRIDTKFNTGSIGKMFTAVAVAQLVEQGKLSFDDPLIKAFPDYPNPEVGQKITVHHLLSHTSGIVTNDTNLVASFRRGYRTVKEYLKASAGDTLKFEPGSKLEYSNYGFTLLGAVIEKASGQDYYDYIREHIYKPAGMTNTDNYDLDTEPDNLATGYKDAPGGTRCSNIFDLPVRGIPSGLGYSTVEDLAKFAVALRQDKLLRKETRETVWTGHKDYTELDSKYGYGCIVSPYNGTRIIGHGGGWFGITDKFDFYPELGYSVVILNNIDSDPNYIAFRLREWLTQGHA
jgi:CubicO group peptidase (beta-lactamase class C family)